MRRDGWQWTGGMLLTLVASAGAQMSVVDSPHNLSVSSANAVRAASEDEVCIFCHTPHNAAPIRPLWNRTMPASAFAIYSSRALDARPGQPTGASKMCLSCHDGTIALGNVLSRDVPIAMTSGATIPHGPAHIGTDLRDDHPVSFRFDEALTIRDPHLRNPSQLPEQIRLDGAMELQCTSCHDAHDNMYGDFLVMNNQQSQLCLNCHNMGVTTIRAHDTCNACHQPHTAPSGPYLLRGSTVTETCLSCHDGTHPGAANIGAELARAFTHDTNPPVDPPEPLNRHTTCTSCHDPHTMDVGVAVAPVIQPALGSVRGANASGASLAAASNEHEVCYACHADEAVGRPLVPRYVVQNNTRLEFNPGAASFHPVQSPGVNPDVPSLRPGLTTSSMIYCSDCHGSERTLTAGVAGPHGSSHPGLLAARYELDDFTVESAASYALCYRCHDRNSILGDESFPWHRLHIEQERTSCAVCHDPHGIASAQGTPMSNSHLINFASDVVLPSAGGRLGFRDTGVFSGECFMSCHGANHEPAVYP